GWRGGSAGALRVLGGGACARGRRGVYPPVTFSSTIGILEADEFDREAVLEVTDHPAGGLPIVGCALSPTSLDRADNPARFYQARQTSPRRRSGLGVSCSKVQHARRSHCQSRPS